MTRFKRPIGWFAFLAMIGCSSTTQVRGDRVTTLAQAREDYLAGLAALREADYPTARERLERVARGPSYIVYTPLARLRLADALMFEEKFEEAAEAYRSFTQTALGDPNLHYAYFRLAEATMRSMPADFFLLPPADRKDQRPVRAALKAFAEFLSRFPDSPHVIEARRMLNQLIRIATSFEREVARFYLTRERPVGAVNRLRRLMQDVPEASRMEEIQADLIEALAMALEARPGSAEEPPPVEPRELAIACETYRERFPPGRRRVLALCSSPALEPAATPSNLGGP